MCKRASLCAFVPSLMLMLLVGCQSSGNRILTTGPDCSPIRIHFDNGTSTYDAIVCSSDITINTAATGTDPQIIIMDGWILVSGVQPMVGTGDTTAGTESKVAASTAMDKTPRRFLLVRTPDNIDVVYSHKGDIKMYSRHGPSSRPVTEGAMEGSSANSNRTDNNFCHPDSVPNPDVSQVGNHQLDIAARKFINDAYNSTCHAN